MEGERVFINCTALSYVEPKNVNHELECFIRVRVNSGSSFIHPVRGRTLSIRRLW